MSKERELLRKALHVLTSSKVWSGQEYTYLPIHPCQYKGISAEIKELLAQPEQPPITPRQGLEEYKKGYAQAELDLKREALSDEQIRRLDDDVSWFADSHTFSAVMRLIRSVEKAHGIEFCRSIDKHWSKK